MKIFLVFGGRSKSAAIKELVERYCKMSSKFLPCKAEYIKEVPSCAHLVKRFPDSLFVGLSPEGKMMNSEEFANFIKKNMGAGKDIVFVVGGAEGFSVDGCATIISLSKMTFSHEITRVVLAEQVFRALCIIFSHPYPK